MYKETELKIEGIISKDGIAYINVWSTDCDGCSAEYSQVFNSMDEYYKWVESFWEWAEGRQGFEITDKDNLVDTATYGNGVDGWEDMFSR